jgi:hypothetical protein
LHDWARARYARGGLRTARRCRSTSPAFPSAPTCHHGWPSELAAAGDPARRLVLVGTAAGFVEGMRRYETEAVPPDTW